MLKEWINELDKDLIAIWHVHTFYGGGITTRWLNDTCYHVRTALAPP